MKPEEIRNFKESFMNDLIDNDKFLSLSVFQRMTLVDIAANNLHNVSNRRELLTAFLRYGKQRHYTPLTEEQIEALLSDFEVSL